MKGIEIRVDLSDLPRSILVDVEDLKSLCIEAATRAGATVKGSLGFVLGETSPPGSTLAILLDESHVTCHTYADEGLLALNAFTCGKKANVYELVRIIVGDLVKRGARVTFQDTQNRFATKEESNW